jgi:hypothetical protein
MDVFKKEDFKYNPMAIKSKLKKVGNTILTSVNMSILVFGKFVEKDMTILDNVCKVIGVVAIVDENKNYAIMTVPGVYDVEPNAIGDIEIDGEHYYNLEIEKDEALISDITIVKNNSYIYKLFDVFVLNGKVPFFLGYEDMLKVFKNLPKFTGSKLGKDTLPFEIFVAMIARNEKDPTIEYRLSIKNKNDLKHIPKWVGLNNIYYSYGSTLAKIAGSYFKTGTLVATINKSSEPTKLEKILKA